MMKKILILIMVLIILSVIAVLYINKGSTVRFSVHEDNVEACMKSVMLEFKDVYYDLELENEEEVNLMRNDSYIYEMKFKTKNDSDPIYEILRQFDAVMLE